MRSMNARPLALLVAFLSLASCKEKAAPPPEAPKPAAPAPETVNGVRAAPGKGGKASPGQAEVELFGTLDISKAPGKRVKLFVSKEACDSPTLTMLVTMAPPNPGPPNFFLEFFPFQGSTGYLCAVSLDEQGRIVGAASHPKNPLTFTGDGEVVFDKLDLKLEPVDPPRVGPKL